MGIDATLDWIMEEREGRGGALRDAVEVIEGRGADETPWAGARDIDVLVRSVPDTHPRDFEQELRRLAFDQHSLVGSKRGLAATGTIALDDLRNLSQSTMVARVEAPRELTPELNASLPECRATDAHALVPPAKGASALLGVIDSGIDFTHQVFRNGGTRILALWDQSAPRVPGGTVAYGRVYTSADIDGAISGTSPIAHRDSSGHGTHVASIAAGCHPRDGVACEADLLVVALGGTGGQTLGRSKNAVEAFDWIVREAKHRQRAVSINMSQGMNGGGHAGSSLLELAMDAHCREPGVALVKSAGNEQEWRTHASGRVPAQGALTFEVECEAQKFGPGQLELWFDEADDLEVRIAPPSGPATAWINLANMPQTLTVGANLVRLHADYDPEGTGDNLVTVFFASGGDPSGLATGTWAVELRASRLGADGLVHAWLERTARQPASEQLRFSLAVNDPACTISVPGTARRAITVGSYVTNARPAGSAPFRSLSSFSSCGPTRYGVQKPDLIAPGEWIDAARSFHSAGSGAWVGMPGTSMAAPHVAGAAAILLAERGTLTGEEVRQILTRAARAKGASPDSRVGAGCLDVEAAVALLRSGAVSFPEVTGHSVSGDTFTITTRQRSTASLVYHRNAGRVAAGHKLGTLESTSPGTSHAFDLASLGSGTWHFEVHLFDAGWRTISDDQSAPWMHTV